MTTFSYTGRNNVVFVAQTAFFIFFYLLVFGCRASLAATSILRHFATVAACTGLVTDLRKGISPAIPLLERASLYDGDTVTTSATGRANLVFEDGSQVFMNKSTQLFVGSSAGTSNHKPSLFKLVQGEIFVRMRPNNVIATPAALVAVRGTEFVLDVDADSNTKVTVSTGTVFFYNNLGSAFVNAGQSCIAQLGKAPQKPVTIQAGSMVFEWVFGVERERIRREQTLVSSDPITLASKLKALETDYRAPNATSSTILSYADALSDSHRYEEAANIYSSLLSAPTVAEVAKVRLGYALINLDRIDEAARVFASVQQLKSAQLGLAWVAVRENRFEDAVDITKRIESDDTYRSEAMLLEGIALTRQPSKRTEGKIILITPSLVADANWGGQALAWLALANAADGEFDAGREFVNKALKSAPRSAIVHEAASIISLCQNDLATAGKEARIASQLAPDDPICLIIDSQALISSGRPDAAASAAAKAMDFDPLLPEASYMLGLADIARNDYAHSERELNNSLRLAPSFTPARVALARLLAKINRRADGIELLHAAIQSNPTASDLHEAMGELLYDSKDYKGAEVEYRAAAKFSPESSLVHERLARLLIDQKQPEEAISEAQKAVSLSPNVAQYHATLALAYELAFRGSGGSVTQATSEYNEALALDPQNSVARAKLAISMLGNQDDSYGLEQTSAIDLSDIAQGTSVFAELQRQRNAATALANITQAVISDPSVTNQLSPGGANTVVSAQTGAKHDEAFGQQSYTGLNGTLHAFAQYRNRLEKRTDTDGRTQSGIGYAALQPFTGTTVVATLIHQNLNQSFPLNTLINGRTTQLSTGDMAFGAVGQRLGDTATVWLGLSGLFTQDNFDYPSSGVTSENSSSRSVIPEMRIDFSPERLQNNRPRFSVGIARGPQSVATSSSISASLDGLFPLTQQLVKSDQSVQNVYANATWSDTSRWRIDSQIRQQTTSGNLASSITSTSVLLPSVQISYQTEKSLLVRLIAGRMARNTTLASLMPNDTFIALEQDALPIGDAEQTDVVEADIERYFRSSTVKLFGFQSYSRNVIYGSQYPSNAYSLPNLADRVNRSGVGVRFNAQVAKSLYANASVIFSHTGNSFLAGDSGNLNAPLVNASGVLPYEPQRTAVVALNYVRPKTSVTLSVRCQDSLLEEYRTSNAYTYIYSITSTFPAEIYVDLAIREKLSQNAEVYWKATNLLGASELQFSSISPAGRVLETGATLWF
jgi:tetratricopeptide (TPR) repeat protein